MYLGHPAFAQGQAEIVIDGRANNPLVTLSPDIQYGGHFTFDTQKETLRFNGSVAIFPAYEIYAQLDNDPLVKVLEAEPAPGSTAKDLIDCGTGFKLVHVDITVPLRVEYVMPPNALESTVQ
jgi:hypothetical protein